MPEDPRVITPIIIEKLSYLQYKMIGKYEFENEEELKKAMDEIVGKPLEEYEPKNDIERAQILVYDGYEEDNNDTKRSYAMKALEYDELCADAYTLMGFAEVDDIEKAIEYFRMGETIYRQRYSDKYFNENKGEFFYIIETRPYIRNLYYTMLLLEMIGEYDEAIEKGNRILELCKDDQIGAGHRVVMLLIVKNRWEELDNMLSEHRFAEYDMAEFYFAKSMLNYFVKDNRTDALKYADKLFHSNRYIDRFFAGLYIPGKRNDGSIPSEEESDAEEFIREFSVVFGVNGDRVKEWMSFIRENDSSNNHKENGKAKARRREKAKQARQMRKKSRKKGN